MSEWEPNQKHIVLFVSFLSCLFVSAAVWLIVYNDMLSLTDNQKKNHIYKITVTEYGFIFHSILK